MSERAGGPLGISHAPQQQSSVAYVQAGLRMLAAAARVGLVKGDQQWKIFTDRFATDALNPPPQHSTQHDRELQLLLDAMITCALSETSVHKMVQAVAGWMENGSLRLWRLAPYLTVCRQHPPASCSALAFQTVCHAIPGIERIEQSPL